MRRDGNISSNICGNPKTAGTIQNQPHKARNHKFFLIPNLLYGSKEQDFTNVLYSAIPLLIYLLLCVPFSSCHQLVFFASVSVKILRRIWLNQLKNESAFWSRPTPGGLVGYGWLPQANSLSSQPRAGWRKGVDSKTLELKQTLGIGSFPGEVLCAWQTLLLCHVSYKN